MLKRKLGFWSVFCIAAGAMISSGLFVLPGIAFAQAGPAVVLSYALAAILMVPAMLSQAELATAMPRSGGSYFFIERSMGALPGVLAGMANWFFVALKSAFALVGIGAFASLLVPDASPTTMRVVAVACCVLFTVLNLLSVKGVGRAQIGMVVGLLGLLAWFTLAGLPQVRHDQFAGFLDHGIGAVLATTGIVFVSYGGLTAVASVAEEIHRPARNLPAGMFAASIIVSLLYVGAVFVTVGTADPEVLRGSLTPLSDAARNFLGPVGVAALAIAAVLAFVTTANGGILAASRSPMAMSRDGLLPPALGRISRRFGTPWAAILLTSAFMITVIIALDVPTLVKAASTMMLMLFILVNLSVLIMRRSGIQNYRPLFRAPLFPWLQIGGIAVYLFVIVEMGAVPLLLTAVFALLGVLWYILYVRPHIERESALVFMVKNIASGDIERSGLEEELKAIALERDEVIHDRFDRLIAHCAILDLEGEVSADELFRHAAEALSPRVGVAPDALHTLFLRREAQSSTVVQEGLAIPHIIIPGEHVFDVLLLRCRAGARFPAHEQPVHAVFILVGTVDERNYHLRALMAFAHVVQEHQFFRRWCDAGSPEHLRDIFLLSPRTRDLPPDRT